MSTSVNGNIRIVFIGAGNVATHLAQAFDKAEGIEVAQVYSRTIESATSLSDKLNRSVATDKAYEIISDADVYIVSMVDDAVASVVEKLPKGDALWLHTSGSLPKEILAPLSRSHGVFYPLQTFSKDIDVDVSIVPIFIEGSDPEVVERIERLARGISDKVFYADGELRRKMHIAAVFACNFTNHLWTIADDLLKREGLGLEVLHPLLAETLRKAMASSPAAGQTGPAKRGDRGVMDKHISMLPEGLDVIYRLLSSEIYKYHHSNEQN